MPTEGESWAVFDASVLVAALSRIGPNAQASRHLAAARPMVAPDLLPFEVADVVRRQTLAGRISSAQGGIALAVLATPHTDLRPFAVIAERVWSLRSNLTAYDAAYVALAELLDLPLITLDARLARSPGICCYVIVPT